jgi:outer membrane protein
MMRQLLCVLCLTSVSALAEDGQVLKLDDAVRLTLLHQPIMREAQATTDQKRAQQDEARAPLLPQVTGQLTRLWRTTNYAPGTIPGVNSVSGISVSGASWHLGNYYNPEQVQATQLLWDFNYTLGKFNAAREATRAQEDTEKATQLTVVLTARTAFFAARANKDLVKVAKDTLHDQDAHLEQTKSFVQVGTQPEISLATAETNKANALVQLITAQNNYDVSKATLNQAMGVEQSTDYEVADESLPPLPSEDGTTDQLLGEALAARPEFAAIQHQVDSQHYLKDSAFGGFFPAIYAETTGTDNGTAIGNLVPNFNAGVYLTWNIFQGLLTPAQVREQEADIANLEAQRDALRLQVRLQVDQARLAVKAAKAALTAAKEALVNANEQLRLAEGRYQTGGGSIIELEDAQVAQTSGAAQLVGADYNLSSARAQLLQALGRRP